jgi:hypothetical protein
MPAWRCAMTLIRRELEDLEGTREALQSVRADGFRGIPHDNIWLVAMTFLAEGAGWAKEQEAAAELEGMLRPFSDLVVVSPTAGCLGPVSRLLGLLAAGQGRGDEAALILRRSIAQAEELQSPPLQALTRVDYAEVLAAQGDSEGAARSAGEAFRIGSELGMARVVARANRILER